MATLIAAGDVLALLMLAYFSTAVCKVPVATRGQRIAIGVLVVCTVCGMAAVAAQLAALR